MKKLSKAMAIGVLLASTGIAADFIVPGMPGKFKGRAIGSGGSAGVRVEPKRTGMVKYTTHVVLCDSRVWTSMDGKPLDAKLLAFEDVVMEIPEGEAQPPAPEPPSHPTVVRNDKVRLLVNNKPVEVPLARLCQPDRDFIEQMRQAHQPKTPPTGSGTPKSE